jgi:hypothetical protein
VRFQDVRVVGVIERLAAFDTSSATVASMQRAMAAQPPVAMPAAVASSTRRSRRRARGSLR